MPVSLHEQLRDLAAREERPVNAQIVYLIRQHVEQRAAAA